MIVGVQKTKATEHTLENVLAKRNHKNYLFFNNFNTNFPLENGYTISTLFNVPYLPLQI